MAKNLGESLGLLAYYESVDTFSREKMLRDFASEQTQPEIEFITWILEGYPAFLEKAYRERKTGILPRLLNDKKNQLDNIISSSEKNSLNNNIDDFIISVAKKRKSEASQFIAKYLKRKVQRKKQKLFEASEDISSIVAFIINNEVEYQQKLIKQYE